MFTNTLIVTNNKKDNCDEYCTKIKRVSGPPCDNGLRKQSNTTLIYAMAIIRGEPWKQNTVTKKY